MLFILQSPSKAVYNVRSLWQADIDEEERVTIPKNVHRFKLAQWFQRRRFFKKLTDGRQVMAIAHTGELKRVTNLHP